MRRKGHDRQSGTRRQVLAADCVFAEYICLPAYINLSCDPFSLSSSTCMHVSLGVEKYRHWAVTNSEHDGEVI